MGRSSREKPSRGAAESKPRSSSGQDGLKGRNIRKASLRAYSSLFPKVTMLAEAEALQQRAERKRGLDAVPVYEQAAVKALTSQRSLVSRHTPD